MDGHRKGPVYSFSAWTLKKGEEIDAKKAAGESTLGTKAKLVLAWFGVYLLIGFLITLILILISIVLSAIGWAYYEITDDSASLSTPYGGIRVGAGYAYGMKGKRSRMTGRPGRERMLARPVRR